ncbi:MAG: methylmalonyl-CoA mutase family protein, partial [bacterium]
DAGIRAGLEVDAFAPRLSFFFNAHNNLIEEIAKFRAARRLWAGIMKNRFGAKDPKSLLLRFHTQTAGCTLTAQQPDNNVIRVTIQALAAVLGGTQSLHTNSLDEALGLPSDRAAKIAVRTQQIVLEESGAADIIDPLGGSFAVESLTDSIESRAAELIEAIDGMGGMVKAIERGYPQREIEKASYEYQKAIENGEQKVIGVNIFNDEREAVTDVFRVDPAIEANQVAELEERRKARDDAAVAAALETLDNTAAADANLFPPILEAVRHSVTVGRPLPGADNHPASQ